MSDRAELARHLHYYQDLGVPGLSRDPAWRERAGLEALPAEGAGDAPAPRTAGDAATLRAAAGGHASDAGDASDADGARASGVDSESAPDVSFDLADGLAACGDLDALRAHIGPACDRCKLCGQGRSQVVFGVGNPQADLMFVGEAPGADEDRLGEPFVGRAGQLLTKIIESIGFARSDVYIANVIKCRPPGNRNPEPDEVATCEPFLFRQIDLVRPKIIIALGTFAARALLRTDTPISRLRGRVHDYRAGSKLIPTFHPAFLLRSPDRKRDVWEDMKKVRALLADPD